MIDNWTTFFNQNLWRKIIAKSVCFLIFLPVWKEWLMIEQSMFAHHMFARVKSVQRRRMTLFCRRWQHVLRDNSDINN